MSPLLDSIKGVEDSTLSCKPGMFRDLFETFGANGFLIAFGVLTSIVIARILGPEMERRIRRYSSMVRFIFHICVLGNK